MTWKLSKAAVQILRHDNRFENAVVNFESCWSVEEILQKREFSDQQKISLYYGLEVNKHMKSIKFYFLL